MYVNEQIKHKRITIVNAAKITNLNYVGKRLKLLCTFKNNIIYKLIDFNAKINRLRIRENRYYYSF